MFYRLNIVYADLCCLVGTVSGSVVQTGPKNKKDMTVTMTWSPTGTFTATSSLSTVSGLALQASIVAPENMASSISVTHTGDLKKWENTAAVTCKKTAKTVSFYSSFDQDQMNGKVCYAAAVYVGFFIWRVNMLVDIEYFSFIRWLSTLSKCFTYAFTNKDFHSIKFNESCNTVMSL